MSISPTYSERHKFRYWSPSHKTVSQWEKPFWVKGHLSCVLSSEVKRVSGEGKKMFPGNRKCQCRVLRASTITWAWLDQERGQRWQTVQQGGSRTRQEFPSMGVDCPLGNTLTVSKEEKSNVLLTEPSSFCTLHLCGIDWTIAHWLNLTGYQMLPYLYF